MRLEFVRAFFRTRFLLVLAGGGLLAAVVLIGAVEIASVMATRSVAGVSGSNPSARVLYESDFLRDLQNGKMFRNRRSASTHRDDDDESPDHRFRRGDRSNLGMPSRVSQERKRRRNVVSESETYRTVCVRLCDGSFFPISTSTSKRRFAEDAKMCAARCDAPSRLYVYKTVGGNLSTMVDQDGNAYEKLDTAYLFKTTYNQDCKCRPHPWETASTERHASYATKAWRQKARRLARREKRKAWRQRHATRKVRRWLERFEVAGPAATDQEGSTEETVVRTTYRTDAAPSRVDETRRSTTRSPGRRQVSTPPDRRRTSTRFRSRMSLGATRRRQASPVRRSRPPKKRWLKSIFTPQD